MLCCIVLCCAVQYGGYLDTTQSSSSSIGGSEGCCAAAAADGSSSSKAMVSIPQGHGDLCDIPASHVFPLSVMKFKGTSVAVPGDVPAMLRYRYGDTYMIPR